MRASSLAVATLLIASPLATNAASTLFYGLAFGRRYNQTFTIAPTLLASKAFEARAFVYATTTTTGSIKKPNNATVNLVTAGNHLEATLFYDAQGAFNSAWPLGSYTINISNASDGTKASTMYLGGDLFPTPARVNNFVEAQAIPAGQNFVLKWDSLVRPATDLVEVRLEENGALVFETPAVPGVAGALNGTTTSVTIPGDRLQEGRIYSCMITVWRPITKDTTTIVGAQGQVSYISRTILPLRTRFNVQDVRHYGVEKRVIYEQSASAPALRANGFEMTAYVSTVTPQSMTGATFRSPAGTLNSLAADGAEFTFTRAFAAPGPMEAAFVAGAYEMQMQTKNNGLRTNTLTMVGQYPATAPQVANIDEAQYIKPASAFTLSWNLTDGVVNDFVQVAVTEGTNVVFTTPAVAGVNGALNGTARSITIPAGTFEVGKTYLGSIRHCRPVTVDTFTYPTAVGMSGHARVTRFPMQVASGPSPQPLLLAPARTGNQTDLAFSSVRGEKYVIQSSVQLPNWTTGPTVTASGASTVYRLPVNSAASGFYRIMIAP